jgi:hypothetical protein
VKKNSRNRTGGYIFFVLHWIDSAYSIIKPTCMSQDELKRALEYHYNYKNDAPYMSINQDETIDMWENWTDGKLYQTASEALGAMSRELKQWKASRKRVEIAERSGTKRKMITTGQRNRNSHKSRLVNV